jgi:hypothetical protein
MNEGTIARMGSAFLLPRLVEERPEEKSFSISKKVSPVKKEKGILQRIFLEGVPPERSGGGRRRGERYHASGAYAKVPSHHAARAKSVALRLKEGSNLVVQSSQFVRSIYAREV